MAVHTDTAVTGDRRARRVRVGAGAGRGVRTLCRAGARRNHGGGGDRADRRAHGRAHPRLRGGHRAAAAVLRARRAADRRTRAGVPQPAAPGPGGCGRPGDRAGCRVDVQRHRRATAGHPGLHRLAELGAGQGRTRRSLAPARRRPAALQSCEQAASTILQNCGTPPAIAGIQQWFNTPGDAAPTAARSRGRSSDRLLGVLVHQLPAGITHVEAWYRTYAPDGLVVIGVHTPEYAFEHVAVERRRPALAAGHHLPGRPGQRLHDLERLRQRILARRLPHRRHRSDQARGDRRGRICGDRVAHPAAADRRPSDGQAARRHDLPDTTPTDATRLRRPTSAPSALRRSRAARAARCPTGPERTAIRRL